MWIQPEENWNLFDPDILRWLLNRRLSLPLLTELTEIRLAIEPVAAALAAQSATRRERTELVADIARIVAAERGDDEFVSANIAFHDHIMQATRNRFFAQLTTLIDTALRSSLRWMGNSDGVEVTRHLKAVAAAVVDSDASSAEAGMRKLIQYELDLIHAKMP